MTDFVHVNGPSVEISASTTSARVAFAVPNVTNFRAYYTGSGVCFMQTGDSTVTASAVAGSRCAFIAPGSTEMFTRGPNDTHIAAITTTGTGTLYIQSTTGE